MKKTKWPEKVTNDVLEPIDEKRAFIKTKKFDSHYLRSSFPAYRLRGWL
jgi:hypothetical protein